MQILRVAVTHMVSGTVDIGVPNGLSLEQAIAYAREHKQGIPLP